MFYVFFALDFICLWAELFPCFLLIVSRGKFGTWNHSRLDDVLLQEVLHCRHLLGLGWLLLFDRPVRCLGRSLYDILNGHPSHFLHLNTIISNRQTLIILQNVLSDIMEVCGRENGIKIIIKILWVFCPEYAVYSISLLSSA